ncbi:hypothetical protein VZ94_16640 [Methylocucumis oryzae]|uniref:Uncharacterized protein n=2 Tax=Methylocucumis oryzae TaxID=1632867 RepID=A0A0F3IFY1_9GAMM|nr:hypothetical protein VZ94_16640 [Methylocucumis oryzae]
MCISALVYADSTAQTPAKTTELLYLKILQGLQQKPGVLPTLPDVPNPYGALYNPEAIIPPQCYTRTEGERNPCYVCHQNAVKGRENTMNDGDLQAEYSFSDIGFTNHWQNLFEDRSAKVAAISDDAILKWVNEDNYSALASRLRTAKFKGWIPDLAHLEQGQAAFDADGFAKDGSHWVAFNYKPLPSTFWPTNGSTDDVMIRLPEAFRTNSKGQYSADVYKANLAILEAKIKGLNSISSLSIDEKAVGQDLNGDNLLTTANQISKLEHYVGAAEKEFIDTFLYPEHTEFLHTVRYLGINDDGQITLSKRMKEVRYMRKWKAYRKIMYRRFYQEEGFEKDAGNLPGYTDLGQRGLDNGMGWAVQGFIEDKNGHLRASTFEENMFCMGCHNSIGSTIDKTFSFPRKVDGAKGWTYINLKGMPDAPNQGETEGEILTYFKRVGGGDEFRSNTEMKQRWFNADGTVNQAKVKAAKDLYELLTPSKERALLLNKAYRTIVDEQDFIYGRDATVTPPKNVYDKIDSKTAPTLPNERIYPWDIRLDWQASDLK